MTAESLLPWQERQFHDLMQLRAGGRLGHAWLVSGISGIGKLQFVRFLARSLLCQQPLQDRACERCNACHLFDKGSHPDWFLLQPPKRLIVVDQIREAIDFANNTSQRGGYKILCVDPAEAMNLNAANALLKLLEEPPTGTLLFLLSQQPGLLLATLRSRCQRLLMPTPSTAQARAWLEARGCSTNAARLLQKAGGAPLRALAMSETGLLAEHDSVLQCVQELLAGSSAPIQAARKCEKFNIVAIMDTLLQGIAELARHLQCGSALSDPQLQPLAEALQTRDPQRAALRLHGLHASSARTRKILLSSNNPNALLVLEQVFGEWSTLRSRPSSIRTQDSPWQ
jgi:DNA polymerase III subunit delta'